VPSHPTTAARYRLDSRMGFCPSDGCEGDEEQRNAKKANGVHGLVRMLNVWNV